MSGGGKRLKGQGGRKNLGRDDAKLEKSQREKQSCKIFPVSTPQEVSVNLRLSTLNLSCKGSCLLARSAVIIMDRCLT